MPNEAVLAHPSVHHNTKSGRVSRTRSAGKEAGRRTGISREGGGRGREATVLPCPRRRALFPGSPFGRAASIVAVFSCSSSRSVRVGIRGASRPASGMTPTFEVAERSSRVVRSLRRGRVSDRGQVRRRPERRGGGRGGARGGAHDACHHAAAVRLAGPHRARRQGERLRQLHVGLHQAARGGERAGESLHRCVRTRRWVGEIGSLRRASRQTTVSSIPKTRLPTTSSETRRRCPWNVG